MILITGATGKVGGALANILSKKGVAYTALVRDTAKAEALGLKGARFAQGSYDDTASLAAAMDGVTKAFLLPIPGPKQVEQGHAFIEAAKAAGVQHIVKLSNFAPKLGSPNPLADRHAQTNLELENSGIAFTHLFGNFFMQNLLMYRAPIRTGRLAMPCGMAKVSMIDVRDIAAVAAAALTGTGLEGRTLELTGAALTFKDVAEQLGIATALPVSYKPMSKDDFQKFLVGFGFAPEAATNFANIYSTFETGANAKETPDVKQVLGRAPTPFLKFARDYALSFK